MTGQRQSLGIAVHDGTTWRERAPVLAARLGALARRVLVAMHEARRAQAERELRRHIHLLRHAQTHPLRLERPDALAPAEPGHD
jgi:hypothetical protein